MNHRVNDASAAYIADKKLLKSGHSRVGGNPVPAGYKQTEVGVIPVVWDCQPFGDVLTIKHGKNQKLVECEDGPYPILASGGEIGRASSYLYNKPSVLIGRKGTIDKPRYIECPFWTVDTLFYSEIKPKAEPKYVYYQFCMVNWREYNEASGVPSLNASTIERVLCAFPGKTEQTAIANALSDVDALIDSLEALIAKKQAIKTATMQQLLTGRTRLPQFARRPDGSLKGTQHTELGKIPEDWYELNIGKDAVLKARIGWQALTTKEYLDSGTNYLVTGTDFDAGAVNWDSCCYVSEWRYKQDTNIQLKKGDVLITKDGTIGKVGLVRSLPAPATLNSGVFVIRPKKESFQPEYLFYVLTSRIFDLFMKGITAGSTITHLYQKDFVSFSFYAPSKEEQVEIVSLLSAMEDEIKSLEHHISKTRQLKQGMMQELLTGRIRLI